MPSASPLRLALVAASAAALFAGSLYGLLHGSHLGLLAVTFGYFGYEVLLTVGLGLAALLGIRRWREEEAAARTLPPPQVPTVAVLIAAHNERLCIVETLESLRTQSGVDFEVLVASDGSTDGMNALLVERYGLRRVPGDLVAHAGQPGFPLRLLSLPKQGKGAALNAGLARTTAEVLVTLDADTTLGPGALRALAEAFADAQVEAASGFLHVRNAASAGWLTRYQFTEYVKNFLWRIGLAHLGVNLQVSGAFGGLRASTVRRLGGFSVDSLVEDYEIVFRLHQRLLDEGQGYRVVTVPLATAFTDSPGGALTYELASTDGSPATPLGSAPEDGQLVRFSPDSEYVAFVSPAGTLDLVPVAGGVRQTLHRARERFADLLLDEVIQSLDHPDAERLEQELIDLALLEYCRPALERRG